MSGLDIKNLLAKMSIDEKIDLCEGADYWHTREYARYGIPSVMMCDGPHGLRKQEEGSDMLGVNRSVPATCFPSLSAAACSWDTKLLAEMGRAIGEEARAKNVSLLLGPGLNIKRDPLCGRNFEYFSEDPYLSGKLAAAVVRGVQSTGVGSCIKHFAANSQEHKRFNCDSVMDERTLREIYLTGFEIAVRESAPQCVMSSYNKLNGEHTGDSKRLLTDILRNEWGFNGMVVTDWGAMNDRVKAFKAGCDLNMPGGSGYGKRAVKKAIKDGRLSQDDIDRSAERVLRFVHKAQSIKRSPCSAEDNDRIAQRVAENSAVLLKNNGALPLSGSVCLIGSMAKNMRYQGVGSSHINPLRLTSPCDCMDHPYAKGCTDSGETTQQLLDEAAELAASVRTPVVFAGLPEACEAEGYDRENMRMPEGHIRLIETVARANPNTVVVLMCGCAVETPWIDSVNAVLYMALPGQAGGAAIKRLLYGEVNPSGKLAETWPLSYDDVVTRGYYAKDDAEYREGVFVGYRYYDSAKKPVRFKFGHGLSYTEFKYSDLNVDGSTVSVTVTNTGTAAGAEAALLFIRPPETGLFRPVRELKGFAKAYLEAGESKTLSFELCDRSFAVYDGGWRVARGAYTIEVGGLEAEIYRDGEELAAKPWQGGSWYEHLRGKPSHADWEKLIGHKHQFVPAKKGEYTMDNTVGEMMGDSAVMRLLHRVIERVMARGFDGKIDYSDPEFKMMMSCAADASIRNISIGGGIDERVVELALFLANARPLERIKHIFKR